MGERKAEIPQAEEKSFGGSDALAIYRPTGAKTVDAAKAMGNFNGWTYLHEIFPVHARSNYGTGTRRISVG